MQHNAGGDDDDDSKAAADDVQDDDDDEVYDIKHTSDINAILSASTDAISLDTYCQLLIFTDVKFLAFNFLLSACLAASTLTYHQGLSFKINPCKVASNIVIQIASVRTCVLCV